MEGTDNAANLQQFILYTYGNRKEYKGLLQINHMFYTNC